MTMKKSVSPKPATIKALQKVLSDTVVLSFSAQRAHWNVQGIDFNEFHDLFGEIYEETEHVEEGLVGAIGKGVGAVAQAVGPFVKKTLQNTAQDMFPGFANPSAKKKQVNPAPPANTSPTCESKDAPFEGPLSKPDQHGPKSRAKHLAKMAMKKMLDKAVGDAAEAASKKKVNETDLKDYLSSLYADQLSEEDNKA